MNKVERDLKIIELYTQKTKSINQIAKEVKCSWDTVKKVLLKNNIDIQKQINQFGSGNNIDSNLFSKINNAAAAYWLGFLYADGSIKKDKNEIALELKEEDIKTVQDFHNYCKNNNTIRKHIIKRNGKEYISYVSSFSNAEVKQNLAKLGCTPQKSLILTFPTEEQVPQEFIYDFVRGYIDGDGYIQYDFNKHRYRIVICGTKEFLKGLINRLELFEYTSIDKDYNSNIYLLTISNKENVYSLLEKIYDNSEYHLERKFKIYADAKRAFNK